MEQNESRRNVNGVVSDPNIQVGQTTQEEFHRVVFPHLFHFVDQAAMEAQARHIRYFRWSLVLLVLAALPTLIQSASAYYITEERSALLDAATRFAAILAALFFAGTLFANFLIRLRQHDREWYLARALAESIKSIVWKFMMGAEPYGSQDGVDEAEERFLTDMHEILMAAPKLTASSGPADASCPRVTPAMRSVRAAGFSNRLELYSKFRIDYEWQWYSRKARQHAASENWMFNAVIACQFTALVLALTRIAWPKTPFHLGPMLAALAAALLAWSQLRRFGEQATAYSMAARDLGFISERARFVNDSADLARYVADSENAISREHTMWLARREVPSAVRRSQATP